MTTTNYAPEDYVDKEGYSHITCACGHTVTTSKPIGTRITLCPNCRFMLSRGLVNKIVLVLPDRASIE